MSDIDWTPDPRHVPHELEHPHEHAYYTPTVEWATMTDKLNSLTPHQWVTFAKYVDVV